MHVLPPCSFIAFYNYIYKYDYFYYITLFFSSQGSIGNFSHFLPCFLSYYDNYYRLSQTTSIRGATQKETCKSGRARRLTDLFFWISYGYCIIGSTFFRLFVSPSATTILIRSGIMNGNTHQPSTVTRPTGPALLVYIIINQAVPNA